MRTLILGALLAALAAPSAAQQALVGWLFSQGGGGRN